MKRINFLGTLGAIAVFFGCTPPAKPAGTPAIRSGVATEIVCTPPDLKGGNQVVIFTYDETLAQECQDYAQTYAKLGWTVEINDVNTEATLVEYYRQ